MAQEELVKMQAMSKSIWEQLLKEFDEDEYWIDMTIKSIQLKFRKRHVESTKGDAKNLSFDRDNENVFRP